MYTISTSTFDSNDIYRLQIQKLIFFKCAQTCICIWTQQATAGPSTLLEHLTADAIA